MIEQTLITSFILGLSTSPACLGVCLPVLLPHIGVVGGEHPLRAGLSASLFFALGRLVLYMSLGLLLATAGASLQGTDLGQWAGRNTPWPIISRLLLAILIIIYGSSVVFDWPRIAWCRAFFHGPRYRPLFSMLLGLLVGSILCPALWLALLYAARLDWLPLVGCSIVGFWLGSSLLMVVVGTSAGAMLKWWGQAAPKIRGIAGATLMLVGVIYLIGG